MRRGLTGTLELLLLIAAPVATRGQAGASARRADSLATASRIRGVYIPRDLREALDSLPHLSPELVRRFQSEPEDSLPKYHLCIGMSIRNNWGLWAGSRLARYFRRLGVRHPDDMSGIILTSLWRELNHQPIHLRGQVACIRRYYAIVDSSRAVAGDSGTYYLPDIVCGPSGPTEIRRGFPVSPVREVPREHK